ncbi:MAG: hypothetical protein AABW50_01395 [Nanoarchaeota archaeon]
MEKEDYRLKLKDLTPIFGECNYYKRNKDSVNYKVRAREELLTTYNGTLLFAGTFLSANILDGMFNLSKALEQLITKL